ncbi:MAG TPA: hypothetical protein VD859_17120 [Nocardioides sp.]|nr:hypothetical protein [Nocardioides sp.]
MTDDPGDTGVEEVGAPAPRRRLLVPGLLAVALLAALAGAVWTGLEVQEERAADERARDALSAGREAAVAFTSYHHRRIEEDLDRVSAISTGEFREEFTAALGALTEAIQKADGVSEGEVTHLGIVRHADETVVLIAAVDATITNKQTERPSLRRYRLEITLTLDDDAWLISDITPVA